MRVFRDVQYVFVIECIENTNTIEPVNPYKYELMTYDYFEVNFSDYSKLRSCIYSERRS